MTKPLLYSGLFTGRRVLVLGGRGFMGSHLTDALLADGAEVCAFDRPSVLPVMGAPDRRDGLQLLEGDFTSSVDLGRALGGIDACVHLVSTTLPHTSNLDPVYDAQTNLIGSLKLIELAVRHNLKRLVFVSSGGTVYGRPSQVPIPEGHSTDPLCAYGITKLAIEKHLQLARMIHGLDYTVLRLANPYGERQRPEASQGAVAVFLSKALTGQPIEVWGDGSVVRDFVYISDVVEALKLALTIPLDAEHRVFNIGSGCGVSINQLLDTIRGRIRQKVDVRYLPARSLDVPVNVLDIRRAALTLGWAPKVSLGDGVDRYRVWLEREWLGVRP